jgi:hypothetical protein
MPKPLELKYEPKYMGARDFMIMYPKIYRHSEMEWFVVREKLDKTFTGFIILGLLILLLGIIV